MADPTPDPAGDREQPPTPEQPPTAEQADALVLAVTGGRADADTRFHRWLRALPDAEARAVLLDPLALAAGAGSGRALEVLLAAVQGERLAMATIHRLVIDHHDAEDVEQEVLINVARSLPSFRGEARFTTWLHQLTRNVAIDFLRRRKEATSLDEAGGVTAAGRLSSLVANRTVVVDAVTGLSDDYRVPVALRDLEGLTYQEIADRLDLTLNTVKSRIHRGRALLAGLIDLDEPLPGAGAGVDADPGPGGDPAEGEAGDGG